MFTLWHEIVTAELFIWKEENYGINNRKQIRLSTIIIIISLSRVVAPLIIMIYSGFIIQCSQVTSSFMDKVRRILVHICKDGGVPQPAHFLQVSSSCPQRPFKEWPLKCDSGSPLRAWQDSSARVELMRCRWAALWRRTSLSFMAEEEETQLEEGAL